MASSIRKPVGVTEVGWKKNGVTSRQSVVGLSRPLDNMERDRRKGPCGELQGKAAASALPQTHVP